MRHTVTVEGPAAPGVVWERYAQYGRWAHWAPHLRAVETEGDRIRPGARGVVLVAGVLRGRFLVTEVDEPKGTWTWQLVFLGIPVRVGHTLTPHGTGTRVVVELTAAGPVPLLYAPMVDWALHRLTRV
ncbi:SRPBCC family protein [Streptomyces sp. NBC_00820]|uniref:SRPBCC family protein n=1 Tax=Streptomyces sp. NBC_00820 TaxID=2975842 RepID=UPI002ED32090|nr:SRPBCC family protein [Streptomyces sp. NBC_00820]